MSQASELLDHLEQQLAKVKAEVVEFEEEFHGVGGGNDLAWLRQAITRLEQLSDSLAHQRARFDPDADLEAEPAPGRRGRPKAAV